MAESILVKEFADKSDDSEEIEKLMLPSDPIKPGDTWDIDMGKVAALMSKSAKMTIDASKASGSGKLRKTYKKDGMQFGKLTVDMKMPITRVETLELAKGSAVHITMEFDGCIDGTSETGTMTMKMEMSMTAPFPGAGGKGAPPAGTTMEITMNKEDTVTHRDGGK